MLRWVLAASQVPGSRKGAGRFELVNRIMRQGDPEEQEPFGLVPGYEQEHLHMFAAVKDMLLENAE